jgi:hypothetical protein
MTGFLSKANTAVALGLPNIARAVSYRLGVKLGLNPVRRLKATVPKGPFFQGTTLGEVPVSPVSGWQTSVCLFSRWPFTVTTPTPDWLANPFTGQRVAAPERGWWQIPDFDPAVGDIKLIWELSRMDWVLAFAQRARNGDGEALARLNDWLADWSNYNPPYRGPNWKCGQEASIRVMHLAMAAMILGQVQQQPTRGLLDLVRLHLQRIAPTVQYAMAQDNNHGTSEAAALYIGGGWLAALGVAGGAQWQQTGRYWLENRAARLIGPDGSFSQYSLNYHRVMLDTFCMVEVWRRHMALPAFSARWQERALAATQWLYRMISPLNGDGPNLGANDGTRLLQLTDTAYRDHRPSVQLAMALFADLRAYAQDGHWNNALQWLGVLMPQALAQQSGNRVADDGGFAVLRRGVAMAMLRYPRFKFRPSQADALHLDLWLSGDNLMRDAGSYSYNTEPQWLKYFGGTASHNTVQFDDRDQMPRLSRFLFGDWLKTSTIEALTEDAQATRFGAGYRDAKGASHQRSMALADTHLVVVDKVAGFACKGVLRWRLMPGDWHLSLVLNDKVHLESRAPASMDVVKSIAVRTPLLQGENAAEIHTITVQATMLITRCEIVQGWESRHYLEKTSVQVLEVEFQQSGTLTTEYRWVT